MAGNDSGFMPQFSKLDASFGHTLLNDGKGKFQWIPAKTSGFFHSGEARGLKSLKIKGINHVLLTENGKPSQLFKLRL
jgi:hypothetical protein